MKEVLDVLNNGLLDYSQKILNLAYLAESTVDAFSFSEQLKEYMEKGIICDLNEGCAPYRPRYLLPDYDKFIKNGSQYLSLDPPENLMDALNNLLIIYKHVPSITGHPVFLGRLDQMLEPFITDEITDYPLIKNFLLNIDRTITSSFATCNIGPEDTRVARLILKAERELKNTTPGICLRYSAEKTSDDFAIEVIETALEVSNPFFCNHEAYIKELGAGYGIASCYNGLMIGGGTFTLVRLNIKTLATESKDIDDFMTNKIPLAVQLMDEIIRQRTDFLVNKTDYFTKSFLIKEDLLNKEKFFNMFGIFGLADGVNHLLNAQDISEKYGHSAEAFELADKILKRLTDELEHYSNEHCLYSNGKYYLHAQSGIHTDVGVAAGVRVPIGEEPELLDHILFTSKLHKYFPAGANDIFNFDKTAKKNPQFILDVIKGAIKNESKSINIYCNDSDLIRVTGYLVKKSQLEDYTNSKGVYMDNISWAHASVNNLNFLNRKVSKV